MRNKLIKNIIKYTLFYLIYIVLITFFYYKGIINSNFVSFFNLVFMFISLYLLIDKKKKKRIMYMVILILLLINLIIIKEINLRTLVYYLLIIISLNLKKVMSKPFHRT